jgi:hypothetical protein
MRLSTLFLLICFLISPAFFAQTRVIAANQNPQRDTIALVPFWGNPIAAEFGNVLNMTLRNNARYRPFPVDMVNLPPDVPEGGFPPYICPSPSLTAGSPYAMTGEVVWSDDYNIYVLRLYLWEMETRRLVSSDEMQAADKAGCEAVLPPLLEWMLSWLPAPEEQAAAKGKWLYLGLRAGPSFGFYQRPIREPFVEQQADNYYNINAAVQASAELLSFLAIQTEMVFTRDYAPFVSYQIVSPPSGGNMLELEAAPFVSWSMMIPLSLKLTIRKPKYFAAVLGGAYLTLPLGEMWNESPGDGFKYSVKPPFGITAGINSGVKAGPGYIFLDIRWNADLGETVKDSGEAIYKRGMVSLSLGYEIGFFTKK